MTGNTDPSLPRFPNDSPVPNDTVDTETLAAQGNRTPPEPSPAVAQPAPKQLGRTRISYTWIGLVVGALVLLLLLVFILQNTEQIEFAFLLWSFSLPLGVGALLAAITGALIMALVGGIRILQIRRAITRS